MAYYFNLPDKLTTDQELAVDEPYPIALSGGPGTGKTVVNLWRHIYNYENGNANSLLLTYTKTLEYYLKLTASKKNAKAGFNVKRTLKWCASKEKQFYDEIIVDEAQDVELSKYQIIKKYANNISYGADPDQSLYLNKIETAEVLEGLSKLFDNEKYTLYKNHRNSKEILSFVKAVFPNIHIPNKSVSEAIETGILPFVTSVGWDKQDIFDKIIEIVDEYKSDTSNIGILMPTQKQVDECYNNISTKVKCTRYQSEMEEFEGLENIHITTFKSAKGIEFDTVIIPNFDSYEWFISNTNVSENEYYVGLTRAKRNLFLVCKNNLTKIDNTTFELE